MRNTHSKKTSRKASQRRGERHSTDASIQPPQASQPAPQYELIKLGVDTHVASYTLARMIDNGRAQPSQTMSPEAFLQFAQKQKTLAKRVVVAYEAGPLGFHLARQLQKLGIECLVVAPQDWDQRHKRTKTDKIDAQEILSRLDRYLAGNRRAFAVVRIPSLQEEVARDLSRERDQFKKERQRMINRGHALLRKYGLTKLGCWWDDGELEPIHQRLLVLFSDEADQEQLAKKLIGQMGDYAEQIQQLSVRLQDLSEQLEAASRERHEQRIKGIGHLSMEKMKREVCDWGRFQNRRQVGSYTGLCPGRDQSGGRGTELSVNKCGNPRLRAVLVELAWLLPRWQPDYQRLQRWKWVFGPNSTATRAARKKAIVALARQLAVDLWRIFTGRAKPEDLGLKMAA